MVHTATPLTLLLATAAGAYMLAGSIAMFRMGDGVRAWIDEFENSPPLTYIAGVLVFALGVTLILVHNDWSNWLAGLISLFGWAAAIEGLLLIAWPSLLWGLARAMLRPPIYTAFKFATPVLGLGLLFAGLTGIAG